MQGIGGLRLIEIRPHCLYSRSDLVDMLSDLVNVDMFIARLRPRRIIKRLYYGADLLRALDDAPALRDERPVPATAKGRRRRRSRVECATLKPLDDYMSEVRG